MPKEKRTQMTPDLSNLGASSYQGFREFLSWMFSYVFNNSLLFLFLVNFTRLPLNFCKLLVHPHHVERISAA